MFNTNTRLTAIEDMIQIRIPEYNKRIRDLESQVKYLIEKLTELENSYNSLTHKVFIKGYPPKK